MDTKYCRDCGGRRPIADFSANRRSRDGLAFYCRDHLAEWAARSREARRSTPVRYRSRPRDLVVPDGSKWCPDCGTVKSLDDFPRSRGSSSGRAAYCLPCHNARGKRNVAKRGGSRTYHLNRRYGIGTEEADAMLVDEGGVCAIGRAAPAAHVDHDHETGAVRALLCFNCNGGARTVQGQPDAAACGRLLRRVPHRSSGHRRGTRGGRRPGAARPPLGSQRRPGRAAHTRATGRTSG
jgi:Recombination endonuclease VII